MKILGIESSCDDTSIAIVDSNKNIIANEVLSQDNIHRDFQGIVPELAARNHVLFIDKILSKILSKTEININQIDLISATAGPGLIGGLLVGLSFYTCLAQRELGFTHLIRNPAVKGVYSSPCLTGYYGVGLNATPDEEARIHGCPVGVVKATDKDFEDDVRAKWTKIELADIYRVFKCDPINS